MLVAKAIASLVDGGITNRANAGTNETLAHLVFKEIASDMVDMNYTSGVITIVLSNEMVMSIFDKVTD